MLDSWGSGVLCTNGQDKDDRKCSFSSIPFGQTVEGFHFAVVYIEYQSVCPFVGTGSPPPLTRKRVCLPHLDPKGGGATLPCEVAGEGGIQFEQMERKPGSLYSVSGVLKNSEGR